MKTDKEFLTILNRKSGTIGPESLAQYDRNIHP